MKKVIAALVLVVIALFVIYSCSQEMKPAPKAQPTSNPQSCTLSSYRSSAEPLMDELSSIAKAIEIREPASRQEAREKLQALRTRINQVRCKNEFPLKHETLEYSVKHTLDALDYADAGDYQKMSQSLDYAILNIEQFQDWTVDVDK